MEVQLYQPHQNQNRIHYSINNEPYKYYVLNIGRQFGKTMLAMNQTYYWAFNQNNIQCAWVSPIYKQCKKVFDEMVKAFEGTGLIQSNVLPSVRNSVCSSKEMKPSLQYGGKYTYSYSGKDGVLIGKFTIDRNDCGFSAKFP